MNRKFFGEKNKRGSKSGIAKQIVSATLGVDQKRIVGVEFDVFLREMIFVFVGERWSGGFFRAPFPSRRSAYLFGHARKRIGGESLFVRSRRYSGRLKPTLSKRVITDIASIRKRGPVTSPNENAVRNGLRVRGNGIG